VPGGAAGDAGGLGQGVTFLLCWGAGDAVAPHACAAHACNLAAAISPALRTPIPHSPGHAHMHTHTHARAQTLSDGKPIIVEGLHLDPALFIPEFARAGVIMLPARTHAAPKGGSPPGTTTGSPVGDGGGEGGAGGGGGPGDKRVHRWVLMGRWAHGLVG